MNVIENYWVYKCEVCNKIIALRTHKLPIFFMRCPDCKGKIIVIDERKSFFKK